MATGNAKIITDIKSAKIALKVCRTAVTKSITRFQNAATDLQKNEQGPTTKQLRLAASLLEAHEILKTKVKKMETAHEEIILAILNEEDEKLSKNKDEIVDDYEVENETYMENSTKVQTELEELIEKAELILVEARQGPTQPASQTGTAAPPAELAQSAQHSLNDFRPHSSQKPNFLEKGASHLEVKSFCEQIQAYIITGYRSSPPAQGVWFHVKACMHSTWYIALEQKGSASESLGKIIEMLTEESCLRNPVHSRRMGFLQSKRGTMTHSDFWMYLEEQLPLIEFEKLTVTALAAHIFLQESDPVMRKMCSEHLEATDGRGDARKLMNEIRSIEASQWYDSRHQAKRIGSGVSGGPPGPSAPGGGRWCTTCLSSTHNTDKCWGTCGTCGRMGHPTDRCWETVGRPQGPAGAAAKMVQINPTASKPEPTPEELAAKKAKKREKNKRQALKKKEKKEQKKKEEEAKSAATGGETPPLPPLAASSSSSSSEEDSPRKSPIRNRMTRVLGGNTAKKSLFQYLNTISEDEGEKLGEEIERCYRAKTVSDGTEDTAVVFADLHSKLAGGRKSREIAIMDSGCTRDIVSEDIARDLGLQIQKLDRQLNIVTADGSILNIIGTTTLFFACQATGDRKRKLECAVLSGGKDREVLVSLKNLKKMGLIHPTFPNQTVYDFLHTYSNKNEKSYSSVYKAQTMEYYTKSKPDLKKPSKEAKTLQNKLISKHHHNFVDKLTKNDRLNVKPVELQVNPDKLKQTKPTTHLRPYDIPFHLRKGFEAELLEMLEAGIIEQCTSHTDWNTKAFPVPKSSDPTKCRIVGDFRGLNNILLKLYWHTESSHQLLRHIDPQAKYFCVIDATSAFHQVPVSAEASKLLTIFF